MAISVRVRFEVFKRDNFTCRYCGKRSPEVVLEIDHIVPQARGGSDDPMNLLTSCWNCNRGKGARSLNEVMTGEDPHDRAIEILERQRQLEEFNQVLEEDRQRREAEAWHLWTYWQELRGNTSEAARNQMPRRDLSWLMSTLTYCPYSKLREFIDIAVGAGATRDFRYVAGCLRNWRESQPSAPAEPNAAKATVEALDQATDAYIRATGIDLVFETVQRAETHRRHIGRCPHQPACYDFIACALRFTREWLDESISGEGNGTT